jgi:hypothetical protein
MKNSGAIQIPTIATPAAAGKKLVHCRSLPGRSKRCGDTVFDSKPCLLGL